MAQVVVEASDISTNHLKNISADKAIDYAAPILAITALGEDLPGAKALTLLLMPG